MLWYKDFLLQLIVFQLMKTYPTVMGYDHKIQELNDSLRQLNPVNLITSVNNEGFPKLPMLCKWGLNPY
jgi:hypothetical protein